MKSLKNTEKERDIAREETKKLVQAFGSMAKRETLALDETDTALQLKVNSDLLEKEAALKKNLKNTEKERDIDRDENKTRCEESAKDLKDQTQKLEQAERTTQSLQQEMRLQLRKRSYR